MEPAGKTTHRLGRYHLSEPVGGGPTGEVFRAVVRGVAGFEREFALKKFHKQLVADGASLGKLRAATRLYAGLEHPRIARLVEHNLDGPEPFAAVEWVSGIDLSRLVSATFGHGRPLPAGAATALLSRAARAVGFAHGRGQTHLGLCPTNLICTPAGEVKVTDFGLLSSRLGERPTEDQTLLRRLSYLSPEQISAASTSPATDVFCLGSIFYELLSGEKAFSGKTGREIGAAVLGASPSTDAIPKPLARVLDRCFAQSPFERYPGGSALADAIDASARGMLMRGDQRDVAKAVQEAMERLESMRKSQVSGVLSFPMPRPPLAPGSAASPQATLGSSSALGVPNLELDERVRDEATTDIHPVDIPGSTIPSLPPPVTPRAHKESGPPTLPPLQVGSARAPNPASAPSPSRFGPPPSPQKPAAAPPPPPVFDKGPPAFEAQATVPFERDAPTEPISDPGLADLAPPIAASRPLETVDGTAPPDTPAPARPPSQIGEGLLAKPPSNLGRMALVGLGLASLGALGFFGYLLLFGDSEDPVKRPGAGSGSVVATVTPDAASAAVMKVDAAAGAVKAIDAGAAAVKPVDAAPATAIDAAASAPSGADAGIIELKVTSKPRRAIVYLDGTKIGKTPVKVDIGSDKHRLVLIRAGHKLHISEIKGGGDVHVDLEPVTPSGGPAGIKVRCRKKSRYYAFIDGKETGQLCPTERIEVELGPHTVEVYDPVTDSRRRWEVEVVQTNRSHRVRVDF